MRSTPILLFVPIVCFVGQAELRAEDAAPCKLRNVTSPAAKSELFLSSEGGSAIAKFTGGSLAVELSEFPAELAEGARIKVATADGQAPAVRLEGWVAAKAFRYFANEAVSLVGPQVRLTKGMELFPLKSASGGLEFEHAMLGSRDAEGAPLKLRGTIPCSAVVLAPPGIEAAEPPSNATWYHSRSTLLQLFDRPHGIKVVDLRLDSNAGKVFWSAESPRSGWLHVVAPGDVTLDGWVRAAEMEKQPYAELIDLAQLGPRQLSAPSLALAEPPKTLTATADLPLFAKAEDGAASLGMIETGATFFEMEASRGWSSIVPTNLAVMPVDGAGFWVKTASLPKP